ncbi:MAG: sodium:proton antiporter [Chloroflexota bacterium]|nr:sodium:proton antiporter [Chloroflexota bacterium]
MNVLIAVTIGVLVAVGLLQLQQRDLVRVVVGLYTLWNALNLLMIAVASIRGRQAPLVDSGSQPMADPLVQALVLTAIVISFGFTAFLVTLVFWLARRGESIDVRDFQEARK